MDRFKLPPLISCVVVAVAMIVALPAAAMSQCFDSSAACVSSFNAPNCVASVNPNFDINLPCAAQALLVGRECRAAGGRLLGCAVETFGAYLSCNGGLRARRIRGRRLRRASQLAAVRSCGGVASTACW